MLERQRERHRPAQRMADHRRPHQAKFTDQGRQRRGLGRDVGRRSVVAQRMAGAGAVDHDHAVALPEFIDHAVVEMGHLAAQAMHQQQVRADTRVATEFAHVQARAGHVDELSFRRQELVDAARRAVGEPGQGGQHQGDQGQQEEKGIHRALSPFR